MPAALVVTVLLDSDADAPLPGALNVTLAPLLALPFASVTNTDKGAANALAARAS
jgi:hypothetical protein